MAGKDPKDFSWNIRRLDDQRPGGFDPSARLEDMDTDHVRAEVLYGGGPLPCQDAELRTASYAAYNDWLADFCAASPKRLLGMAYIPCDRPELAIAEVKRCAARGLRGCVLPRFPDSGKGHWHAVEWDPFWRTLLDVGWPGGIHVGGTGRERSLPDLDPIGFISDLMMSKFAMAEACTRIVLSGLLEKYPELKIVSVEGQLGWLPFVTYYLDHLFAKHRYLTMSTLKEPPSFYFKRQVFATFMEDPVGLREREYIGVENIMWSSDYPHSETTWPNSKQLTDEWMTEFPEDERRNILFANAERLYNL